MRSHSCGREGSAYTFLIDEMGRTKKEAYEEVNGPSTEPRPVSPAGAGMDQG